MRYKDFNGIGLSRLGFGNMRLPEKDGRIDRVKAAEMIDVAMKAGVNYYDTAFMYHSGDSEAFLGEVLPQYPRQSYCLATKFNIDFDSDYRKVFAMQQEKLKTDYFDFYLIHCITDSNVHRYVDEGGVDFLLEQQRQGRIRYLGFSCHSGLESLRWFANHHKWDFAQLQLNYFDWLYSATQQEYKILEERDIPIMVMEPVRGGRLSSLNPEAEAILHEAHPDWSIASWAMRFVLSLPQVQTVLSGMSRMEQVQDNLATFSDDYEFTHEDRDVLFKACAAFKRQVQVPCTACRYCCDECPMGINIPEFLKVYNKFKVDGTNGIKAKLDAIDSMSTPADCLTCGECLRHCPQGIRIPEIMTDLNERFY